MFLFLTKHAQTYQLLEATIAFLGFEQTTDGKASQDSKNTALKVLKICPIFIETLQKIYNAQALEAVEQDTNSFPDEEAKESRSIKAMIMQKRLSELVFALLTRMLCASSKTSEGANSLGSQQRLLTEEKVVFDFIE